MSESDAAELAALASAVRELVSVVTGSVIRDQRVGEISDTVRQLANSLRGVPRVTAEQHALDDLEHGIRFFSPVSGPGNPSAPPLSFAWTADGVSASVRLDARFGGPPGYVHGGVTAMLFDEALGQAAIRAGHWGMTAFLNVTYLAAAPLDTDLVLRSRVTDVDGRKAFVSGELELESEPGTRFATAEALFVVPRADTARRYFDESVTSFRRAEPS
jgi:acyl-coenzyme A thioesterase PaaI-like protein